MFRFLIVLLAVYPLLFIWQGLDVTDMGFWLTNYNLIFTNPDQVTAGFVCYLSNIIGGLWLFVFGWAGVLGVKVCYVFCLYGIMVCAYQALKDYFDRNHILFALLLTLVFTTKSSENWIGYNNLTALFYALSAVFLCKSIKNNRQIFPFFAGFFIGLNPFVRFPNILSFLLLLLPAYYDLRTRKDGSGFFGYRACLLGIFSSFVLMFVVMLALNHVQLFVSALKELFTIASSTSNYSGVSLFEMFIRDHVQTFKTGGVVLGCYVVLIIVSGLFRFIHHMSLKLLIGVGSGILCYYFLSLQDWLKSTMVVDSIEFTGVLYVCLIIFFITRVFSQGKQKQEFLILLSLGILVLAPLGSGNGIRNSVFGMWFAIPLVCCMVFQIKEIAIRGTVFFNANSLFIANATAVTVVFIFSVTAAWGYTYRDSEDRMKMIHGIDHPKLRGVLTTETRAEVVQQLLDVMPKYVKKGEPLLAIESIPLLYYLTGTKPYLKTAWPLLSSAKDLEERLDENEQRGDAPPPVVKATVQTRSWRWPDNQTIGFYKLNQDFVHKRDIFKTLINDKRYSKVWQNDAFEIWMPGLSISAECFYQHDYVFDDFTKEFKHVESIAIADWNQMTVDKRFDIKDLNNYCSSAFAIQGIKGEFGFQRRSDGERSFVRIYPLGMAQSPLVHVLQIGPRIDMNGLVSDESMCVLYAKIRCQTESVPHFFVQDKADTLQTHYSFKGVTDTGKWQECLAFKKIRNNATVVSAGLYWKPRSDQDWVDLEFMDLFNFHN